MDPSFSRSDSLPLDFNEDDDFMEVASVLLQLKQLIEFQNRSKELIGRRNRTRFFPVDWGPVPKRRRSAEVKLIKPGGCSPSPEVVAVPGGAVTAPGKGDDEVESDSPVSPFTFSPSDTEEKPNRLKRKISDKKEEMVGIPDLNMPIPIDVVEPVDDSKGSTKAAIAAAEARQRRIRILREKRF